MNKLNVNYRPPEICIPKGFVFAPAPSGLLKKSCLLTNNLLGRDRVMVITAFGLGAERQTTIRILKGTYIINSVKWQKANHGLICHMKILATTLCDKLD